MADIHPHRRVPAVDDRPRPGPDLRAARRAFESLPTATAIAAAVRGPAGNVDDLRVEYANAAARRTIGCAGGIVGHLVSELLPDAVAPCVDVVEGGRPTARDGVTHAGVSGIFDVELSPWYDGLLVRARDVSRRRSAGPAAATTEDVARLFVDGMASFALVTLDTSGGIVDWNAGAQRMIGFDRAAVVGRHLSILYAPEDVQSGRPARDLLAAASKGQMEEEAWRLRSDGSRFWADTVLVRLVHPDRGLCGFVEVVRDISARRREEVDLRRGTEQLRELASSDALTGLRNRREFDRVLRAVPHEHYALLAIDADRLKATNDKYGHEAGDALLCSIATTLSLIVRPDDTVARVGGDEFGVLLPGTDAAQAAGVAERMRAAVADIVTPAGDARISVGWIAAPGGVDPQVAWRFADEALYDAKRTGRNRVVGTRFDPARRPRHEDGPDASLIGALLGGAPIRCVYQPIVHLGTGMVAGYEALARPSGMNASRSVAPLFTLARRVGRIRDLDWLCWRSAVGDARAIPRTETIFINASAATVLHPFHDVDQILLLLRWGERPPESVVLEINDQEEVEDVSRLRSALAGYREQGIRVAFDDVGEVSTTLELLVSTQPEFIKLSCGLTAAAALDRSCSAIDAAVAFARSTGAAVIAKGVEDEATAHHLRTLGVEFGQGRWLGLPAASVEKSGTPIPRARRRG